MSPNHSLSTSGSEESSSVGSGPISSLSQTILAQIAEKERIGKFDSHKDQESESRESNLGYVHHLCVNGLRFDSP